MKWFRVYHDLPNDRKLRKFSSQQKWAWVVLLCLASDSKQRGLIVGEDEDILAEDCGFDCTQDFQYFLDKLRQQDMIEPIEGGLKITHWNARQFASDDVTARTSASKAKKKSPKGTSRERSLDVPGNDEATSSDTEYRDQIQSTDSEKNSLSLRRFSHSQENLEPEEREVLHSLKEREAIVTAPDFAAPKCNPVKNPNPVENHFPATPSAAVEKVLPPWRLSWAVDDYDHGFCEDVLRRLQKQWPGRVMGDAIAKIYNAEQLGKRKQLEADYSSYLNRKNATPPPAPSVSRPSEKLSDAREVGLPQDLSEAIAAIQTKLAALSWSNQDAARWMKYSGRWACERGATKALFEGKGAGFARLADDEILDLLDTLSPLNPGQCIPELQMA